MLPFGLGKIAEDVAAKAAETANAVGNVGSEVAKTVADGVSGTVAGAASVAGDAVAGAVSAVKDGVGAAGKAVADTVGAAAAVTFLMVDACTPYDEENYRRQAEMRAYKDHLEYMRRMEEERQLELSGNSNGADL